MKDDLLQGIRQEVARAVKDTVNGKIDRVTGLLNDHIAQHAKDMDELRPFIQAKMGGAFIYRILLGMGSIALSWAAIKSAWPHL